MRYMISCFFLFLIFTGCEYKQIPISEQKTDFHLIIGKMISPICLSLKENATIYVTDYVNEKNLQNNSKLGFLLSNETKVALTKCNKFIKIKELQLANKLKISPNGTKMLSRKLKELKIKYLTNNHKILIGTYIITKKQLIIFSKLINLENANTLIANSISIPLTNEIKELEGLPTQENIGINVYTPFHL